MPIKDAVRTNILSRNWRYKWYTLQDLVFDNRCYWGPGDWRQMRENFGRAVKAILDVHPNSRKFELSCWLYSPMDYLDDCINTLSTKSIQEIVINLRFYGGYPSYETPSDLYKCQHLVHLKLIGCVQIIPPSFKRFMSLVTLYLDNVELPVDLVKNTNDSRN
ncbi:F-box/FBD/LRR-repeat protein At1g13570-like [Syzygium oleosum]|uniref:F-box/FBD/LRR-repeat protein At1g13570-like n=1 Tax=Syzygium oleosum TaxID=219896 RepID=UPI0011D1B886|nr:F-box/FBD/LRR-repeat protein At1g13570-like [Syzygium oleosum]